MGGDIILGLVSAPYNVTLIQGLWLKSENAMRGEKRCVGEKLSLSSIVHPFFSTNVILYEHL